MGSRAEPRISSPSCLSLRRELPREQGGSYSASKEGYKLCKSLKIHLSFLLFLSSKEGLVCL